MSKIVGGVVATPPPKPDWKENNHSKGGYIKNKPFEGVDTALDINSTNPVQNKVVAGAIGDIDTALDGIIALQQTLIGGDGQ